MQKSMLFLALLSVALTSGCNQDCDQNDGWNRCPTGYVETTRDLSDIADPVGDFTFSGQTRASCAAIAASSSTDAFEFNLKTGYCVAKPIGQWEIKATAQWENWISCVPDRTLYSPDLAHNNACPAGYQLIRNDLTDQDHDKRWTGSQVSTVTKCKDKAEANDCEAFEYNKNSKICRAKLRKPENGEKYSISDSDQAANFITCALPIDYLQRCPSGFERTDFDLSDEGNSRKLRIWTDIGSIGACRQFCNDNTGKNIEGQWEPGNTCNREDGKNACNLGYINKYGCEAFEYNYATRVCVLKFRNEYTITETIQQKQWTSCVRSSAKPSCCSGGRSMIPEFDGHCEKDSQCMPGLLCGYRNCKAYMDMGRAKHTDGRAKVFGENDNCCFDPRASSKKNDISSDLQIFIMGTDFQADSRNCNSNPPSTSYVQMSKADCEKDALHYASNDMYLDQIKKTVNQVPTVTGVMFGGDATHVANEDERDMHDQKMTQYFTDQNYDHVFHGIGNHDISNRMHAKKQKKKKKKNFRRAKETYFWMQNQIKKYKREGWQYTFEEPVRSNVDLESLSYFIKRGSIAYFHLSEHYAQKDIVIDEDEGIVLKSSGDWFIKVLKEFNYYFTRKDREDLKAIVLIYHISDIDFGRSWRHNWVLRRNVQKAIIKFNKGELDSKWGRSYAKHPIVATFSGHIHSRQKWTNFMGKNTAVDDQILNWGISKIPTFYIGSREYLAFISLEINDKSDDPTKNWFRVYSHSYNPDYVPNGFSRWGFRKDHGYVGPMCIGVNGYAPDNKMCTKFYFVDNSAAKTSIARSTVAFQPGYPLPGYYRFGNKMSSGNTPNEGAVCPEGFRYSEYNLGGSDAFKFTGMHADDGLRACGEWCREKNFPDYDVPTDECKGIEYNHNDNECILKFGDLDVWDYEQGWKMKSCIKN